MKKVLKLLLIIILHGCTQSYDRDVEMWSTQGFPEEDFSYDYMWFRSIDEGYLFGTYSTNWPEKSTLIVYKTIDGGLNWKQIDSMSNILSIDHANSNGKNIFLEVNIGHDPLPKNNILKFDIDKDKVTSKIEAARLGGIWTHDNEVFFATRTKDDKRRLIKQTDINLNPLDSIFVEGIGSEYAVFFGKEIYNITRTTVGDNVFFKVNNRKSKNIHLDISPQALVKLDDEHIVLLGTDQKENQKNSNTTNPVEVYRYNIVNDRSEKLHVFNNHTIMKDFKFNGAIMTVLVGNMKSLYNEYDLAYSLDNGNTWKIKELQEKSYVNPTAIVNNVLYIMSGGGRMQKITF